MEPRTGRAMDPERMPATRNSEQCGRWSRWLVSSSGMERLAGRARAGRFSTWMPKERVGRRRDSPTSRKACDWQNANLRTQFARIIRRAGFEPWPKLWQNLRSTRETELTGPGHNHPLHVVTAWLGNTEAIAREHYLQITDSDFERAATLSPAQTTAPVDKTVRKLVRYGLESPSTDPHAENGEFPNSIQRKKKRPHAETCDRSEWRIGAS